MIDTIRTKIKERKRLFITGLILFFLMFTNPNFREYKEFKGTNIRGLSRSLNCFIFSVYKERGYKAYSNTYYLGIAKNFIQIN